MMICFVFSCQPLLPSPFTQEDARQLIQHCLKGPTRSSAHVFCDCIVASEQFVNGCKKLFEPLMKEKAEAVSITP